MWKGERGEGWECVGGWVIEGGEHKRGMDVEGVRKDVRRDERLHGLR